jgi:hypothetical protein
LPFSYRFAIAVGAAVESACAIPQSALGVVCGGGQHTSPSMSPASARRTVAKRSRVVGVWLCSVAVIFLTGCDAARFRMFGSPTGRSSQSGALHTAPKSALATEPVWGRSAPGEATPAAAETTLVNLVGLDERQVEAVLGPPTEQEDRAPAKTWRYRSDKCTVDLALYPDVQTRVFRTLSYEVMTRKNTAAEERLCLTDLQARRHAK